MSAGLPALLGALGWIVAALLCLSRTYFMNRYIVAAGTIWELPGWKLLAVLGAGVLLGWGAMRADCRGPFSRPKVGLLLNAGWLIAAAAFLANYTDLLSPTILELLGLVLITALAVRGIVLHLEPEELPASPMLVGEQQRPWSEHRLWVWAVVLLAVGFGVYWFYESKLAYEEYRLLYWDWGHFARRLDSTVRGRGFLRQTPYFGPFWDHFNPGLALLVPLWAVWPGPELIFTLQAVCLASPALLVFGLTRAYGASRFAAGLWAVGYLTYPVVGQINLSFVYGWHPVSQALPLMFGSLLAMARGKRWVALGLALLACSFKENVWLVFAGACFGLGVLAWWPRRRGATPDARDPIAGRLSARRWFFVMSGFLLAFVVIYKLVGFGQYQTTRFPGLGEGLGEVMLSPITKPGVFWPRVLEPHSFYFLALLLVPLAPWAVLRGGWALFGLAIPLGMLLVWSNHPHAKTITIQYPTTMIPVLFLAAWIGTRRGTAASSRPGLWRNGAAIAAGCLLAAMCIGAIPGSAPSTSMTILEEQREAWTRKIAALDEAGSLIPQHSAVLASNVAATRLIGVDYLEPLTALPEPPTQEYLRSVAGEQWIFVFDWVLLNVSGPQASKDADVLRAVGQQLQQNRYEQVFAREGVLVFRKPAQAGRPSSGAP